MLVAGCVALLAVSTLHGGSGRALALALAFPIASFLFPLATNAWLIGTLLPSLGNASETVIFAGLVFVVYFACVRFTETYDSGGIMHTALVSVAATSVILVVWTNTPVVWNVWQFQESVSVMFADPYRFWWLIGAFGALAILRR